VRTTVIVFSPPRLDDLLGLGQCLEPVHIQTLRAQGSVERLPMRVVSRFSWPREVDLDAVVIRPKIQDLTGELRPVVTEQQLRSFSLLSNLVAKFNEESTKQDPLNPVAAFAIMVLVAQCLEH
jgi:hypothetical protein